MKKVLLLLFSLLLPVGVVHADPKAPRVVFDEAHGQRFHLDGKEELDLTSFGAILRSRGIAAEVRREPVADGSLKGVQALVISGPFDALPPEEVTAILDFVDDGGKLAIMLHIPQPVEDLLHQLGVDFTNGVVRERDGVIDGNSLNFRVTQLEYHPVTEGLLGFNLYGAWGVVNMAENATIIASTSPRAWIDLNGDNRLSPGDAVQPLGVVVAGKYGAGSFVVFGDDALFQNRFIKGENEKLAARLAEWLKSSK